MADAAGKAVAGIAGLGFVYYFPKVFTTLRDWECMPLVRSKAFYEREKEIIFDLTNGGFVYGGTYDDGNPRRQLSELAHGMTQQYAKPWPGGKPPEGYPHNWEGYGIPKDGEKGGGHH